jgi:hypothetical protein
MILYYYFIKTIIIYTEPKGSIFLRDKEDGCSCRTLR